MLHYSNFFVAFFSRLFLRENRNLSPLRPKMYKVQSFLLPSCLSRQRQTVSFFWFSMSFTWTETRFANGFCIWSRGSCVFASWLGLTSLCMYRVFFYWFLEVISGCSGGSNYKLVPQIFASINDRGKPVLFEPQHPTHRNDF